MTLEVVYRDLKSLIPYQNNTKRHPRSQIQKLKASLVEFGYTRPIGVADGGIIFGHGVTEAALELADNKVPIPRNPDPWRAPTVDLSSLSPAQRRAYVIADNRLAEDAVWDADMLEVELPALSALGYDMALTGFTTEELRNYVPGMEGSGGGDMEPGSAELLSRMEITIADPRHVVEAGDRYVLGGTHYLLCVGVIDGWPEWKDLLDEGALFCPYPGPFVPFGKKASEHRLVMVQPDIYMAGHLLDRYADAHGEESVAKV